MQLQTTNTIQQYDSHGATASQDADTQRFLHRF